MMKIRKEMMKMKERRKPRNSRSVSIEDFEDLEIKRVARRDLSTRRMESLGLLSGSVSNRLIQNNGEKIQVVGSDVEALYPSLEAVEVAKIVYNCIMKSEVEFKGVDYTEACRLIALTSTEQECRL